MSDGVERQVIVGGVDMDDALAAYRQHPELHQWRQTSQTVIQHYVEANAALSNQLREAEAKEADLERHIATIEESNAALVRELEPEVEPE